MFVDGSQAKHMAQSAGLQSQNSACFARFKTVTNERLQSASFPL
jgi:hypothetical protein